MLDVLQNFFHMGGHGFYVFSSYTLVFILLGLQWLIPWRRLRHYLRDHHE